MYVKREYPKLKEIKHYISETTVKELKLYIEEQLAKIYHDAKVDIRVFTSPPLDLERDLEKKVKLIVYFFRVVVNYDEPLCIQFSMIEAQCKHLEASEEIEKCINQVIERYKRMTIEREKRHIVIAETYRIKNKIVKTDKIVKRKITERTREGIREITVEEKYICFEKKLVMYYTIPLYTMLLPEFGSLKSVFFTELYDMIEKNRRFIMSLM